LEKALFILPGIIPGLTGPRDFKGLVVLSNAENLAALTCAQVIGPGTPVVYSAGTFMANMKNFYAVTGSPQSAVVNIAGIQMAREQDILRIAHAKCEQILEESEARVLPAEIDDEIEAYFKTLS